MPKYAGYISRDVIDWSSIAKGLQQSVDRGLEQRRKKIEEDNKLFEDAKKKLGEYENTQSASYNTNAYKLTDESRTYLSNLQKQLRNGEINRSDYKIKVNNLYDQYDSFLNTSKGFDQYLIAVKKKIDEGAGREFVAKANANMAFMGLADGSAELKVGPDGGIYVLKAGEEGPISIKQWTNIENLSDGKIDLAAEMSKYTDKLGQVVREKTLSSGASVTTDDPRQMKEQYNAYRANAIATTVNRDDPSRILSILLDNSNLGYNIYSNKDQIERAINSEISKQENQNGEGVKLSDEQKEKIKNDIESKAIIMYSDGSSRLESTITEQMIKDAEKVAGEMFDAQVDSKITEQAAPRYRSSGGSSSSSSSSSSGGGTTGQVGKTKYAELVEIYTRGGSDDPVRDLTNLAVDDWKVGYDKKGYYIYKPNAAGIGEDEKTKKHFKNISEVKYAFYGNSDAQIERFNKDLKDYWISRQGGQASGGGAGDALFDQK